jgi:predicted  nucleic acid-binding Zn-ribbon protein
MPAASNVLRTRPRRWRKNYTAMQTDLDWYKRQYTERGERIAYLRRSRASLQGQITKLRKQLADREASAT